MQSVAMVRVAGAIKLLGWCLAVALCCDRLAGAQRIDKEFLYVGMIPTASTEGRVWPQPQHQNVSASRWKLNAAAFRFESKGPPCAVLDGALSQYHDVILRPARGQRRQYAGNLQANQRRDPTDRHLNSVAVSLMGRCEEWPHLDMDEKYELHIDDKGAFIQALSVWGLLRGLETFSQLIFKDDAGNLIVHQTQIVDYPRFAHRGVLLDTARHFIPKRILLQNMDALAYNKFNVFHWHIVDDQSFPYQSMKFPQLSEQGAYNPRTHIYSATDIAEVVEYGRQRGIRVIPEFDTPAHTFSWGRGVPQIMTQCFAKNGQVVPNWHGPLNPLLATTYVFLKELFQEVMGLFQDDSLHLGGDEVTFNCWKSNPEIRAFVERQGFDGDYRKLLNYYFLGLFNLLKAADRGRKFIVWQEVFDDGVRLPPGTIVQIWKDNAAQEMSAVTQLGYRAILSTKWYLNSVLSSSDWKRFYKVEPLAFTGSEEQKRLVIGGEACLWGEQVDGSNLMSRLWPRAAAVAERLWSHQTVNNPEEATGRLVEHTCRLQMRGINAEPQNGPNYCKADNLL